ncbi:MAG TPA: hypothetical protein ENO20_08095 [Bacteroides sp.]|nr:hypothetical protein [Bacteroides sp.]
MTQSTRPGNGDAGREKEIFQPSNDLIKPHSQVSAFIEILEFDDLIKNKEIAKIQVFFERIAQEIYENRKKNYTWGFRVIEPEFLNFCKRIVLISKLYKEQDLTELNSVIFKLFVEFNNIVLSTALQMHIPIRGIIRIGDTYRGVVTSKKPALISGKDPLILADLLKVFTFGEIFPEGFTEGLIPAVEMPYHFGYCLGESVAELPNIDAVGIFMPAGHLFDKTADVTILSNMIVETEVHGKDYFACNWKTWIHEHSGSSVEQILAYAAVESEQDDSPFASYWKHFIEYSGFLP